MGHGSTMAMLGITRWYMINCDSTWDTLWQFNIAIENDHLQWIFL